MKNFLSLLFFLIFFTGFSQSKDKNKDAILKVMKAQEVAWSNHNMEGFMQGYWKSDSLKFYGSSGLTFGWDKALANYKNGYPTAEHSGKLQFTIDDMTKLSNKTYMVRGSII